MDHGAYRDLIPAHAIGATDADERKQLAHHLRACSECRALLADYRRLGEGMLWAFPPAAAPSYLGARLRGRATAQGRAQRLLGWLAGRRLPAWGGLAVALVLLLATNLYWYGQVARTGQRIAAQATAIAALAEAPAVELTSSAGAPTAHGVLYFHADSTVGVLHIYALPALAADKTYQVWLIRDGERDSGGLFQVNFEGESVLLIHSPRPWQEYQGVGITVEPAGGSRAPTTPRLLGATL